MPLREHSSAPLAPSRATAPRSLDLQLRELSGGLVVGAPPSGPVLGRRRRRRYRLRPGTLVPLLARRDRVAVAALSAGWAAGTLAFWAWWLTPEHRVSWGGFLITSVLIVYLTLNSGYFVFAANRLRGVAPDLAVPGLRVAFVVTKAPSEPESTARRTLSAMLDQDYSRPYDVWLCDERPTQDTVEWCERAGVRISSRYGRADYHRSAWPRRTRCKEGNLSFFYDSWGYENYDVVAQLDCDHVPGRSYLREMVRPFADHAVGYVAAPSVCDSNEAESWAARGRTHREATFDGPSQTGHNGGLAPVCIGSHYAVRTAALREIGGLGPELAEDFSTSFLLNSAGWEGVFAIDAEAHGEGPNTFAAMITQEYQWARSLVTLLCDLVPRHLPRLPWRLRVRYLYALLYYPSITVAMVAAVLLPPIAAVTGVAWVHVTYSSFLLHWWPVAACVVAITLLLRRRRMLRPRDAPILSWELWLYVLARWPWIAWGVVAALLQKVRPRPVGFHVTPKGPVGLQPLPARLVAPYVVIAVALALAAIAGERVGHSAGYLFLTVIAAGSYTAVALAVSMLHAVEAARAAALAAADALATVRAPLLLTAGAGALLTFAIARFPFGALSGALW